MNNILNVLVTDEMRVMSTTFDDDALVYPNCITLTSPEDIMRVLSYFSFNPTITGIPEVSLYVDKNIDGVYTIIEKPNVTIKKQRKIESFSAACSAQCISGVTITVNGIERLYPTSMLDQQNLAASVTASYNPSNDNDWSVVIWCQNTTTGEWELSDHSTDQVRMVGEAVLRHVETQRRKLRDLVNQINQITSEPTQDNVDLVNSINW